MKLTFELALTVPRPFTKASYSDFLRGLESGPGSRDPSYLAQNV